MTIKEAIVVGLSIGAAMGAALMLLVQVTRDWWTTKRLIREFRHQMANGTASWRIEGVPPPTVSDGTGPIDYDG